jgi:hypothetical protein
MADSYDITIKGSVPPQVDAWRAMEDIERGLSELASQLPGPLESTELGAFDGKYSFERPTVPDLKAAVEKHGRNPSQLSLLLTHFRATEPQLMTMIEGTVWPKFSNFDLLISTENVLEAEALATSAMKIFGSIMKDAWKIADPDISRSEVEILFDDKFHDDGKEDALVAAAAEADPLLIALKERLADHAALLVDVPKVAKPSRMKRKLPDWVLPTSAAAIIAIPGTVVAALLTRMFGLG